MVSKKVASVPVRAKSSQRRRSKVATKRQKKREKKRSILSIIIYVVGTIGMLGFIVYLLFNPRFQITTLAIETPDEQLRMIATDAIRGHLKDTTYSVPNTSQFLWTNSLVSDLLDSESAAIKSVDVNINDRELYVSIEQHEPAARWCRLDTMPKSESDCLAVSNKGVVFRYSSTNQAEFNELLLVTDTKVSLPKNGFVVIDDWVLMVLLQLKEGIKEYGYMASSVTVFEDQLLITLEQSVDSDSVVTIDSLLLPSMSEEGLQLAVKDLMLLLEAKELADIADREDIARYEVVDFTSKNKVFYKFVKQDFLNE